MSGDYDDMAPAHFARFDGEDIDNIDAVWNARARHVAFQIFGLQAAIARLGDFFEFVVRPFAGRADAAFRVRGR